MSESIIGYTQKEINALFAGILLRMGVAAQGAEDFEMLNRVSSGWYDLEEEIE